jgi:hypothetical protein
MIHGHEPNFSIIAVNAEEIATDFDQVGHRARFPEPVFKRVFRILEAAHKRHFDLLKGRYVLTGATKASLTDMGAPGAIRNLHSGGLTFGTHVPQAHYLTKSPHDPEHGQIRKHNGYLSAVMVMSEETQNLIAGTILKYLVEPVKHHRPRQRVV